MRAYCFRPGSTNLAGNPQQSFDALATEINLFSEKEGKDGVCTLAMPNDVVELLCSRSVRGSQQL